MKKSTAAYIIYKNKLLLLLRDNIPTISDPNCWDTPGGSAEINENYEDCLLRELNEELELNISANQLTFLFESTTPKGNNEYSYSIKLIDEEFESLTLHEGQMMRLFSFEDLKDLKLTTHLNNIFSTHNNIIRSLFN